MGIKFLHIADSHIGVEKYGRIDPDTGLHTRLQDFVRSLRFAFEKALDEQVDLVIFSGDAYRTCDPTPTHQREFASAVQMLIDAGVPVVMITGNHDAPVALGKASSIDIFSALEIDDVAIVSESKVVTVHTKSGPVQVACLPWLHRSQLLAKTAYRDLTQEQTIDALEEIGAQIIDRLAKSIDPNYPAILAAHVAAAAATFSGSEQTAIIGRDPVFLTSTLANPAFDYVALGHIHKFQDLNMDGWPHVVYSGSLERIDFGEEADAKGVCIVTIQDPKSPRPENAEKAMPRREVGYRFVSIPARPFVTYRVVVKEGEDPTAAILKEIGPLVREDAIVRVIYDLQSKQEDTVDLKAVKQALAGAFLVASIVPKPRIREDMRRADVSEDMAVRESLHAYIQNHPELEEREEKLQAGASTLEEELAERSVR